MAIEDIISLARSGDTKASDFLKSAGQYQSNRDVLRALGQEDTQGKAGSGLLTNILKGLGTPGRLIRTPIIEALGGTPELRQVSGIDQFRKVLSGEINPGFGDIPSLRTKSKDSILAKVPKLALALTGDVATDPISYIGGAGFLSRKAAAEVLALKGDTVYGQLTSKGKQNVEKLVNSTPSAKFAEFQKQVLEERGIKPTPEDIKGTPLDLLNDPVVGPRFRNETLGNYLAEGLLVSRPELLKRLENITGSKAEALALFKSLPEGVRGGIVATNLLGKPIEKEDGSYIRFTEGTGEKLGVFGDIINKSRLRAAAALGPITKATNEGEAGTIYANVRNRLANKVYKDPLSKVQDQADASKFGEDRFIDYVKLRKSRDKQREISGQLNSKIESIYAKYVNDTNPYLNNPNKEISEKFYSVFKEAFFRPMMFTTPGQLALTFGNDPTTLELVEAAKRTADLLRNQINELHAEAQRRGVFSGSGKKGSGEEWTPLIWLDDIVQEKRALEGTATDFSTTSGRTVGVLPDDFAEEKLLFGYKDLNNPDLIWMDAPSMNKRVREMQKKNGEVERDLFVEDPIQQYLIYAKDLSNKIANSRFIETNLGLGTMIKDIPEHVKVLDDYTRAKFISNYQQVQDEVKNKAEEVIKDIEKQIEDKTSLVNIGNENAKIQANRAQYLTEYNNIIKEQKVIEENIASINAQQNQLFSKPGLVTALRSKRNADIQNAEELEAAQRIATQIKRQIAKQNRNLDTKSDNFSAILDDIETMVIGNERTFARLVKQQIKLLKEDWDSGIDNLNILEDGLEIAQADLQIARNMRDNLTYGLAEGILQDLNQFAINLETKINLIEQLRTLRSNRKKAALKIKYAENNLVLSQADNIGSYVSAYTQTLTEVQTLEKNIKRRKSEIKRELDLEGITNIKQRKKEITKRSAKEQKSLDVAKKLLSEQKQLLKNSIVPEKADKAYKEVMGSYLNELLNLAKTLSPDQFNAMLILSNDKKIEEYIAQILNNTNDSKVALDAMGDMYVAYQSVADSLVEVQKNLINPKKDNPFADAFDLVEPVNKLVLKAVPKKSTLIKEELRPSESARRFQNLFVKEGYDEFTEAEYKLLDVNKKTSRIYTNRSVSHFMNVIYRKTQRPDEFEKWVNDYFDPLQQVWKTSVTVTRGPGYSLINLIGGAVMNYLGDVKMKNIKLASTMLYKIKTTLSQLEKQYPEKPYTQNLLDSEKINKEFLEKIPVADTNAYEVVTKFFDMGGFYNTETKYTLDLITQSGGEIDTDKIFRYTGVVQRIFAEPPKSTSEANFRKVINFAITNKYQRLVNNQAQATELFNRLSAFIDGYEKFGNYDAAMSNVYLLHFNYQDLSPAEEWLRRLMPFYTWTRNNIPAQFRAVMMQPGKIQRLFYLNENFQNTFGAEDDYSWLNQVLPEYVDIADGFATQFKYGDNNIGFYLRLPYQDVNRMFQVKGGVPMLRGREFANLLGPFTLPLELASGVDLATGAPFNPSGQVVPDYYKALGFIPGVNTYEDIEGQTRINQGVVKTIQELLPVVPFAERVVSGVSAPLKQIGIPIPEAIVSKTQQEKSFADLLNVTGASALFGGSAVTLSPTSLGGEVRGRIERQTADIRRLAASGQYDTDWIREQLRNGMSPEQVAILLQSGYGKVDLEKQTLTNRTINKYRESLSGL